MVNIFKILFSYLIRSATTFIVFLILAKSLTKHNFGTFSYILTISLILGLFIELGYNFVAIIHITKSKCKKNAIYSLFFIKNIVSLTIFTITISIMIILYISNNIDFKFLIVFIFLFLATILSSYSNLIAYIYQSYKDFFKMINISLYNNILYLFVIFITIYFSKNIAILSISFFISRLLATSIQLLVFARNKNISVFKLFIKKSSFFEKELLMNIFGFTLVSFFGLMYVQQDVLFIKYYLNYSNVAIYQLGMKIALTSLIISTAIVSYLTPKITQLVNIENINQQKNDLNKLIIQWNLILALLGIFIFVVSNLLNYINIISFTLGEKYETLSHYVLLLSIIVYIRYSGTIYGNLLSISNKHKLRIIFLFIAFIVNLICNIFLISLYGLNGALYSAIITLITLNTLYYVSCYTIFKNLFINKSIIFVHSIFLILTIIGNFYQ